MTFPRVSRRGRHFANVDDAIKYPDLVVARTVIHSKYFAISDWLQSPAYFFITVDQPRSRGVN